MLTTIQLELCSSAGRAIPSGLSLTPWAEMTSQRQNGCGRHGLHEPGEPCERDSESEDSGDICGIIEADGLSLEELPVHHQGWTLLDSAGLGTEYECEKYYNIIENYSCKILWINQKAISDHIVLHILRLHKLNGTA
jgi:hypothetical protein